MADVWDKALQATGDAALVSFLQLLLFQDPAQRADATPIMLHPFLQQLLTKSASATNPALGPAIDPTFTEPETTLDLLTSSLHGFPDPKQLQPVPDMPSVFWSPGDVLAELHTGTLHW